MSALARRAHLPAAATVAGDVTAPEGHGGRVLLVEDEAPLRRASARLLEGVGHSVVQARDGHEAIELLASQSFDVILSDLAMPRVGGIQLLRALRMRDLDVPVLLFTATPSVDSAVAAIECGVLGYLAKPVRSADLLAAVERAIGVGRMAQLRRDSTAFLASLVPTIPSLAAAATLQGAIDTLWMAYQPIVDPRRREVVAYQALVRADDPAIPHPTALFVLAEQLGAVHTLSRAIRAHVSRTMAIVPVVDVFVSLHPSDLLDEHLFDPDAPLTKFAGRVVLEITDRQALDESCGIADRARRLRALGYRIALDDVGAGYAGLSYFASLTPEFVTIDMSLVRDLHLQPIKQKLVGSLVRLGRELGMVVVAEGVESVDERDVLVELGCDLLQGYLFARPGDPFPVVTWP